MKKDLWLTFFLGATRCFVNTFAHQCRWAFLVLNSCEFLMIEFRFEKIGSLFTRIFHRKVLSGFNCCHSRWVQPSFFWTVFPELRIGGIAWASRLDTWAMERLRMWEMNGFCARADNFMPETPQWQCLFGQILVSFLCEKISPLKHLLDSRWLKKSHWTVKELFHIKCVQTRVQVEGIF